VRSVSQNQSALRSNAAGMDEHQVYLNIGSNIQPERNLPRAIELLAEYGRVLAVSTAWETHAVGSSGPNFLNACVQILTTQTLSEFKLNAIQSVESALGRVRGPDKYAPRPIDLDIILWDGVALRREQWNFAYLVIPLAEVAPETDHPITHEKLARVAERLRTETWVVAHPEVLKSIKPNLQG
jgi:2-amino-4-hydroxy-6-hydroxymethyldihydropteridine diphosphokinase